MSRRLLVSALAVATAALWGACKQECVTTADCQALRSDLVCEQNHCYVGQPEPDGGDGDEDGGLDGGDGGADAGPGAGSLLPGDACPPGSSNLCQGPFRCWPAGDGGGECREIWLALTTTTDPGGTLAGGTEATLVPFDGGAELLYSMIDDTRWPRWSPLGDAVAYVSAAPDGGRPGIRRGDLGGGSTPVIDADDAGTPDFPGLEWEPGPALVWANPDAGIEGFGASLLTLAASGAEPAWLPDGSGLVYSTDAGVERVALGGASPAPVTDGGRSPFVSRDGAAIAFQRSANLGDVNVAALGWDDEVWTAPLAGGAEHRIASAALPSGSGPGALPGYAAANPSWSPDGTWIAYEKINFRYQGGRPQACSVAQCGVGPQQVVLQKLNADGTANGAPIALADGQLPAFSPDGTMVAYIAADALWVQQIDPATGAALGTATSRAFAGRHLMTAGGDDARPRWQPK